LNGKGSKGESLDDLYKKTEIIYEMEGKIKKVLDEKDELTRLFEEKCI